MARRSLQASPQGIQAIKKALKRKKWSQTYIAGAVGCSRQTIWSLLQGNPTDCDVFMEVCTQLGLNWEEIAVSESSEPEHKHSQDIDALVQQMRQRIQPYIQERCGTMRVLDMSQPIDLGDIYTNVNLLEKLTKTRGLEVAELIRNADPEQFDRFCLGDVRERRVPGLKAVETLPKLMILGKPGAGKTTFLKHLAIQCSGGKFHCDRVPIFITLKDFAEANGKPNLLEYIDRVVPMPFDPSPTPSSLKLRRHGEGLSDSPFPGREGGRGVRSFVLIQEILQGGRALILLDGLDEVTEADNSRVLRQIREFSQQFHQNQFVITCRIAAKEYTFEQFTEVEIADFDDQQIADFSRKWFRCKKDPIKANRFLQKLKQDAPIRELATSPLLLTLLCLVFEDSGSFPTNRAELYQTGVDVLLKKWDVKRNIERDQIYKRLSLKRKEDLLSHIARTTFEAGNYFFKQREVERYISQYIQNLPEASTDPEALELDSTAVLKSIEAQHGLFVERARGIYSFSHLTFHEYFTARKIVMSCNPYAADDPTLQGLISHITEKRWREVFLLTVGMLSTSDNLLSLMKRKIDSLLETERDSQQLLNWLSHKSSSLNTEYSLSAARVTYFELSGVLKSISSLSLDIDSRLHLVLGQPFKNDFYLDLGLYNILILLPTCFLKNSDSSNIQLYSSIIQQLNNIIAVINDLKLNSCLISLKSELPQTYSKVEKLKSWWISKGLEWMDEFNKVLVNHRNIGHDWQFSDEKKKLLEQYYEANKLLVDCLNSDCYVSREVRQEIEETLLLPIAEIQKRQQRR